VGQIWRGDYNPVTTYSVNDAVAYQGSSFIATQTTVGVAPVPATTPYMPPLATTGSRGTIAALPPSNQANYYARGDNTWQILPATTYVVGPASSAVGDIATYADTTGKLLTNVSKAAAVPAGGVVQTKFLEITSASVTAIIPVDSTVPQITEGAQIGSLSITPFFSNSLVRLTAMGSMVISPGNWMSGALFRGAIANAIGYQQTYMPTNGGATVLALDKFDSPATVSAITYTLRVGTIAGSTLAINPATGAMIFTVQEIRQ
jgi:hypothetical protein